MQYGKHAEETAAAILARFQEPETLPAALARIWIEPRPDHAPSAEWSLRNQAIMYMIGGTADARGFQQWKAVNRSVKKGAKAFYILAPLAKKMEDKATGETVTRIYGFRDVPVFRVEDTEGAPLAAPAPPAFLEALPFVEVARAWGIDIKAPGKSSTTGAQAFWSKGAAGQKIVMYVENAQVFCHELMHAADHKLGNLKETGQHWRSETVAEFGAAVLMIAMGQEQAADLGGAYRYIHLYAKDTGKTAPLAALECLDRICKAAQLIMDTAAALAAAPADAMAS